MDSDSILLQILRCELDATNHQFTHILALQQWQYGDVAVRITAIDDIDFVNSMRIIDYLVSSGRPFALASPNFHPGTDLASILRVEQSNEARLLAALEGARHLAPEARAIADTARAPRAAYGQWLERKLASVENAQAQVTTPVTGLQKLVAQLVTMVEQTLIHAYVEWRGARPAAADAAWVGSGAAMMHLTRLVKLCANLNTLPAASECPAPTIVHAPGETLVADRELARHCAQVAQTAAGQCQHAAIAKYCDSVAKSCLAIDAWDPSQPHPEIASTPPVFHSFAATLRKFDL